MYKNRKDLTLFCFVQIISFLGGLSNKEIAQILPLFFSSCRVKLDLQVYKGIKVLKIIFCHFFLMSCIKTTFDFYDYFAFILAGLNILVL